MKKINAIAWLITMLVSLAAGSLEVYAESKNVTMQEGETQTLYLPSSVTGKRLKSVTFYSNGINYVQVVSYTNYSVKVKAIKAYSSPIIVRCDYYYYVTSGSYTYQAKGYYDYNITVAGETKVKPTKITLPNVIALEVGETKDLEPTVTPANAEYTLTWKITDSSIATVYQNGMITGKSVGETDLKVSADNGVYTMCRISVYLPSPKSVSVKSTLSMTIGETYTLSPTVYPSNSQYSLSWSTDNSSVATVSQAGIVTAKSTGIANIVVKTNNGITAKCVVTVTAPIAYAKITEAKYATFCDSYPRNFSSTGITVYTVTYDCGESVSLKEVTDGMVPANTAVLLYKDVISLETVNVPEGSYGWQPLEENLLRISDGINAKGESVFVLAKKTNGVGFYHWGSDNSLSKGKVFLLLPDEASVREYFNLEDNDATSANNMTDYSLEGKVYYDMHGRCVENPSKGIYIEYPVRERLQSKNGKMIILK